MLSIVLIIPYPVTGIYLEFPSIFVQVPDFIWPLLGSDVLTSRLEITGPRANSYVVTTSVSVLKGRSGRANANGQVESPDNRCIQQEVELRNTWVFLQYI